MDTIEALKTFGLTGQEAVMYITLLTHGPLSGYECAKRAGISRSNAYAALAGLAEKGGAMRSEQKTSKHLPTPKDEFLKLLRKRSEKTLKMLDKELPDRVSETAPYLTLTGHESVAERMRSMLDGAQSHVYISAHSSEVPAMSQALEGCVSRGVKTVLISDACPVAGVHHHSKPKELGQVNIIADTSAVLTGTLLPEATAQCLYSRNSQLVRLMREAFLNELELIERDTRS
ncbi:TrmB family transcriptional regulator [Desulfovibrio ferrophilus]|uniref:Putative transcriptional regulator for lysine biosynthesis and transport n=1 Tax=Desulfovibrio ferrophilus TaxID=241368 RepID=A0A2Z6AZA0_9BACT|nr:TrmB family transcriptional regulator [Desulfovibrio ferrophilus]BBD08601.1 putative transcriptional regulator for lysine biosynthesis and transport [Desulfovibrio ferrophilus]